MGDELNRRTGKYWVLFYQPLPEAGERIAIGLVFGDGKGRPFIEFDYTFAKAAKVFPDIDPEGLTVSLESLRRELDNSTEVETVLRTYGPQIVASTARQISLPISTTAVEMLMARYILPAKRVKKQRLEEDKVAREIEAFVTGSVPSGLEMRRNVAAREILGRPIAGAKKIALAISSATSWTLVDGVDLNQSTPQAAAVRADEISRTFWNYSRAATKSGVRLKRVGVVLNGHSHLTPRTHEAHDYALHRFQSDADLALDAASTEAREQLRKLLQE